MAVGRKKGVIFTQLKHENDMKRFYLILSAVLLLSAAGCSAGNRFVGKWRSTAENGRNVLEFRRDGTASLNGEEVNYEIVDDDTLKIKKGFYFYECEYVFVSGKKLSITGGSAGYFLTGEYEKVKK